jgi:hypothetical protein
MKPDLYRASNHFFIFLMLCQIEMMSETIDETLDKDNAEEETEELTNQVLTLNHINFQKTFPFQLSCRGT